MFRMQGNEKFVSIIITTWNRLAALTNCLESIKKQSYCNYEIIVVDNNSTDNTTEFIKSTYAEIRLITLDTNYGPAYARNIATEQANGELLFYVDSDNILDPDCIKELAGALNSDKSIGFVGPKMYYWEDKKRFWYTGVQLNMLTSHLQYNHTAKTDEGQCDEIIEVSHIPNCWMTRKEVVDKIGLIDTIYFIFYEEADWAIRAKHAGYRILYIPKAVTYHDTKLPENDALRGKFGTDQPYRLYYLARNRLIFMRRHGKNFPIFFFAFYPLGTLYYLYNLIKYKRPELFFSYLKGTKDGLKMLFTGKAKKIQTQPHKNIFNP